MRHQPNLSRSRWKTNFVMLLCANWIDSCRFAQQIKLNLIESTRLVSDFSFGLSENGGWCENKLRRKVSLKIWWWNINFIPLAFLFYFAQRASPLRRFTRPTDSIYVLFYSWKLNSFSGISRTMLSSLITLTKSETKRGRWKDQRRG